MDRFYYRDIQLEPAQFSSCAGCSTPIMYGDAYYDHFGLIACESLSCLAKITHSTWRIAGDEDEV
jgi:hypothetical protein